MRFRFLAVAVVAVAIVLSVVPFQGAAFARAASSTTPGGAHNSHALQGVYPPSLVKPAPPGKPYLIDDPCLWVIQWSAWDIDTNNVGVKGQIENGCGFTLTSGIEFYVYATISCTGGEQGS
jgi:hypothetical protein